MPWTDVLQALAIVLVWGVNFVVIKWGVAGVPPLLLGGLRFAVVALAGCAFVRRPVLPWRWLVLYGLTVGVGQFGCLFSAIKLGMPAGLASVVLQAQAFFTLIFARIWLGEAWQRTQVAGLLLAMAGLGLIGLAQDGHAPMAGLLLTLCGAASWAVSNVVVREMGRRGHVVAPLGLVVWSSLIPPLPFLLLSLWLDGPQAIGQALAGMNLQSLGAVLYLALVASMFGYGLWSRLLILHSAGKVAPFSLLVPVVGIVTAALLLGERLTPAQQAGSALLLAGLLVHVLGAPLLRTLKMRLALTKS